MNTAYNPNDIESRLYAFWEKSGYFKPREKGDAFSVVIPPPNVTGALHMGHALNHTLQDIIVRYKRMQGCSVLWLPGTDHAGIATQNVVEKQFKTEGKSRTDLGRAAFVEKIWEWKELYGNRITDQCRRLGDSVDWSRERFTMDDGCANAVRTHFVKLYNDGLIYQGHYIINWCPRCHTALSDIEVEHQQTKGHIWQIDYRLPSGQPGIVVATTRPETMFGDVAIAVHPEDERYQHLIGKQVLIPFTEKAIPVIADSHVEMGFGTGAVKVTPAHDMNDFEMGKRHNLPQVLMMTESAIVSEVAPTQYQGLDRFACRKKLVEDLQQSGQLVQVQDHELSIGHCYRCQTIVEPYLSKQWFVAMKKLAEPAIEAVKTGQVQFIPDRWAKIYLDWMENIRDWCISRQIWWGHQIPVWYCQCQEAPIVSEADLAQCPHCGSSDIIQDPDVLDTWFSSALWPFSTMGWPENADDFNRFYPTSFLVTGYDILTFWVSRMIVMGLHETGKPPFSQVYVHGLVRDITGKKMSKSIGNVVNPLDLIDEYGADALRFCLASQSTLGGQDIRFSEEKVESCRNFANKIWNAARYTWMILEQSGKTVSALDCPTPKSPADAWILGQLFSTIDAIHDQFDRYNYARATEILWEFVWNTFCDWYVEMSKINKEESLPVLVYVLTQSLKLLHPFMPFVTDEIWQFFAKNGVALDSESLVIASWPQSDPTRVNSELDGQFARLLDMIREIRNMRKELNVAPGKECELQLLAQSPADQDLVQMGGPIIQKLAKISQLSFVESAPEKCASGVLGDMQLFIPLAGLIDVEQEKKKRQTQLIKLNESLDKLTAKLQNEGFLSQAPEPVIQKMRDQVAELKKEKAALLAQISQL